ncbi:hypothetical protein ACEQPO_26020 [Bacillus sp. SL00103]
MDDHMPGPTSPLFKSDHPSIKKRYEENGEKYQVPDLNIKDIKPIEDICIHHRHCLKRVQKPHQFFLMKAYLSYFRI